MAGGRFSRTRGGTVAAALTVGVLATACAAGAVAHTQDMAQDPELAEAALPPEARGVSQAVTAAELAAWGRRNSDAGALIMAARLLAEVPVRKGEGEAPFLTPGRLLDEAAALAAGNDNVLAAIDRLRSAGVRGVESSQFGAGPIFTVQQVGARESYGFDVEARRGEILRVAAIGDGDTNIDLVVRASGGEVLCRDGFGDHYPVCTMRAVDGGRMRVDIVNRGAIWTRVQILSN